jgi:hypothetical protein
MNRDEIITELYNDEMLRGYTKKLSPSNYEDVYQEFLLIVMTKISEEKFLELYTLKELNFYCVRIIKNMITNPASPFNRSLGYEDVSYDVLPQNFNSPFSDSTIDEESNVEVLTLSNERETEIDLCIEDVKKWLKNRSKTVEGAYYDEILFTKYFIDGMTFEEIAEQTKIPKSEVYNNITLTQSAIQTKFKEHYYGIIN